jgi:hypothetical protein
MSVDGLLVDRFFDRYAGERKPPLVGVPNARTSTRGPDLSRFPQPRTNQDAVRPVLFGLVSQAA